MNLRNFLLSLFLLSMFSAKLMAQFPACEDLEVTYIELNESRDTLTVRVLNTCDTCQQHVYTGLIAYDESGDTLAVNEGLGTKANPVNNSTETYKLVNVKSFEKRDIFRIEMYQLCDTLPINNAALSLEQYTALDIAIVVFPNPSKGHIGISYPEKMIVSGVNIIDSNGRTLKVFEGKIRNLDVREMYSGVYALIFLTRYGPLTKRLVIH